ncbi:SRPBCC domain-containing protein [Mycolicibacterium chubuense]|nr:SRPBCC domain-containing protein [Mycolicibacterium chubuense]
MTRTLPHRADVVWRWLTDPQRLARWSPVVPDAPLTSIGARQIRERPDGDPVDGEVLAVDAPHELVHRWGDDVLRWRLTDSDTGCTLTLEHRMADRGPAPMNAAGWHVCFDVLEPVLAGADVPRRVGPDALAVGWEALRDSYADALD